MIQRQELDPARSRRSIEDQRIEWTALAVLDADGRIPFGAVAVEASAGWLTLTGEVDWPCERSAAEADVSKLAGVAGIDNLIIVRRNGRA